MRRARAWVFATTLGWALAPVASAGDPLGDALVAKFATCFETQGGTLTDDDRAVLAASGADLSQAAGITVNGVPCAGELPEGAERPSAAACAASAPLASTAVPRATRMSRTARLTQMGFARRSGSGSASPRRGRK